MINPSASDTCWICLDVGSDGMPLIHTGCACKGEGAGFCHVKCLAEYARRKENKKYKDTAPLYNRFPWTHCPTCTHGFTGKMKKSLAMARYDQCKALDPEQSTDNAIQVNNDIRLLKLNFWLLTKTSTKKRTNRWIKYLSWSVFFFCKLKPISCYHTQMRKSASRKGRAV